MHITCEITKVQPTCAAILLRASTVVDGDKLVTLSERVHLHYRCRRMPVVYLLVTRFADVNACRRPHRLQTMPIVNLSSSSSASAAIGEKWTRKLAYQSNNSVHLRMQLLLPRDPTLNVASVPLNEQHFTTKSTPTKLNYYKLLVSCGVIGCLRLHQVNGMICRVGIWMEIISNRPLNAAFNSEPYYHFVYIS